MSNIWIHAVGLQDFSVYLAHENGNWGPENDGDYANHKLSLGPNGDRFEIDGSILEEREEFKLIIPNIEAPEAIRIYVKRLANGTHMGLRFDFDLNTNCMWLLAQSHDVIRLGEWNQNNIYR